MSNKYAAFGSTRKLPSGRVQASYRYKGITYTGPRTFTTLTEAKDWLKEQDYKIMSNIWVSPKFAIDEKQNVPTFGQAARRHIEVQTTSEGHGLNESTKQGHLKALRNHLSCFEDTPINQIDEATVADWWASQRSTGKITSASKAYKLLSAVMKRAKSEGVIESNPATVRGAQNATSEKSLITPSMADVKVLIEHITPRYKVLVRVMAWSGLRFGEVTALTTEDVTRHEEGADAYYVLNVNKAVAFVNKVFVVGKTKSKSGVRKQRLPKALTTELDEYFKSLETNALGLIFPGANGEYLRNDVLNTAIKRALKSAGLPSAGFSGHSLRRAAATELANKGANVAEVQKYLGDSSPDVALRYIKETGRQSDLIDKMDV